ncbi:papain-like cysteine protease family protein [Phenylobacterium sp.]|uniref:papain-like cysteine protease family protein n=1 Tax=Phenylobacterium sp. TaxID=1871053 RepID=UPI002734E0F7|nr:papain-like cysteine protease family protein [Phenylobacterium sp.]MDP3660976.1 papain-like cysteine protease family protein [Phenylobacterium sp.]
MRGAIVEWTRTALIAAVLWLAACSPPADTPAPAQARVDANGMFDRPLPTVDLPIRDLRQETGVWCWAAVAQQIIMASRGPEATPPQCALVAVANGAPPEFCCNGANPQCVRTGSIPQIQGLISQFGGRTSTSAPPTDPLTLYRTLAMGHAVIIGVTGQGGGHVVVARGMSFQQTPYGWEPLVHINDPMALYTQPVPYRQFAQAWKAAIVVN